MAAAALWDTKLVITSITAIKMAKVMLGGNDPL
jgi:hypothetical protein